VDQGGEPVDLNLDGNRDLLLHLLGRATRPLRDHLHPGAGDIRIGLHGQVVKGDDAGGDEQDRGGEDEQAIVERGIDQRANH
jgi:hypothetical protein